MARSVYVSGQVLTSRWVFFGWICFVSSVSSTIYAQSQVERTVQQLTQSADNEPDPAKAEALYTKALQLLPNADAVRIGRAIVRGKLGRYQEGIADATAAIALVDTAARYYAQRGYLLVQISEYDRAAADYERAIQLKPKEANFYSGLSYCRVKQNRLTEALASAQKGITLNPNSPYSYRNRGRAQLYTGKVDEAITDFQRSLDLRHGEAYRVLTDLGEAYERKKDYPRAADYYAKALTQKPGYPDAEARQHGLIRQGLLPSKTNGLPNSGTKPSNSGNGSSALASTFTGKRVALVVGNSEYINIAPPLQDQPINDAKAIDNRLKELGFSTTLETNAEEVTLRKKLAMFYEDAITADVVFFYFAGHGLQYNGANYLLPTDIEVHPTIPKRYDDDLTKHAFLITTLIEQLQKKNPRFCVIVLDACREDPLKTVKTSPSTAASEGINNLSRFTPPPFTPIVVENFIRNCCVAQATTAGSRAWNGPGRNGCYTEALLRYLKKGSNLEQALKSVRSDVLETSQKAGALQRPEYLNQTTDDLIF